MRYNKETKVIEWSQEDEIYDEEECHRIDYITMNVWEEMASDIYPFIDFTIDILLNTMRTDLYKYWT